MILNLFAIVCLTACGNAVALSNELPVFGVGYKVENIAASDVEIKTEGNALRIKTGYSKDYPGITIKAPDGKWDMSEYQWMRLEVTNHGDETVRVNCRVDNPGADGSKNCITSYVIVEGGKSKPLMVTLAGQISPDEPIDIIGMRGSPFNSSKIDAANITQFIIFVNHPKEDYDFSISEIVTGGKTTKMKNEELLPFIDEFGQFIHKDWQGKCYSVDDMKDRGRQERQYLRDNPGPKQWNTYGGWQNGPKLKATGFFRAEKYKGKWWLIDPIGRLFWSHGIDCVNPGISTPISDRENYFKALPKENSPFARFYGKGGWAPHGYYKDHSPYRLYDFGSANLLRKYGPDYQEQFAKTTHKRLRSWGMNTIANWSSREIYNTKQTPYVATIHINSKILEGSEGFWKKFPDVFDDDFRLKIRKNLEWNKDQSPWCIGFFVSNELSWADDMSLAVATLMSPAKQKAKAVFISDLQDKYKSIEKLNAAWGKEYSSWGHMRESSENPGIKTEQGIEDLKLFYTKTAEAYFRTIKTEMSDVVPGYLYLGCRFAWVNDAAARAASKYCDVVSYNRYSYSVEDLKLPEGSQDKPLIIGEFHFGALDRGMFHTGLRKATDQVERSEHYKSYVLGALSNPSIVGTHWFQYRDQATTGRGDGENYQIGFVDVCDKPYYEIVRAATEVGNKMYEYRLGDAAK